MDVKVLTYNFEIVCVIDDIKELEYTECFREAGSLSMRLDFRKEYYKALKTSNRILLGELIYNIQRVVYRDGEIFVYGVGIFDEFKNNSETLPQPYKMGCYDMIEYFASKMSFDGIDYEVRGLADYSQTESELYVWCTDYYSIITQLCFDYEVGFKIRYDEDKKQLQFIFMRIIDRASSSVPPRIVISDRRESYDSYESLTDASDYKNEFRLFQRYPYENEYAMITYSLNKQGETKRVISEFPNIVAISDEEMNAGLTSYLRELIKRCRKKRSIKVRALCDFECELGDKCYVENTLLEEIEYAVLVERITTVTGTHSSKTLVLEV